MRKISISIFLLLSLSFLVETNSYSKVISWSFNKKTSLLLTEISEVVESNNAIMVDTSNTNTNTISKIIIEDIILEKEYQFVSIFTRFRKKNFSSFVKVTAYDSFTDTQVLEFTFNEEDVFSLENNLTTTQRLYLVVELYGTDIELRSVGMEMRKQEIINEKDFIINLSTIYVNKDNLEISVYLQESASVSLLIYNKEGDICKSILVNKVLDKGAYKFYMNPQELFYDELLVNNYYVWLEAENLHSIPVEFVKSFQIIP